CLHHSFTATDLHASGNPSREIPVFNPCGLRFRMAPCGFGHKDVEKGGDVAVEAKRGCGYRKIGGLYFVGGGRGVACDRLPIPLDICPTCGHGIKQTRGFTWVDRKSTRLNSSHVKISYAV